MKLDLTSLIEKYGWPSVIERCTFKDEHCIFYLKLRARGFSEHLIHYFYHLQMELYSEKSLRLLMQQTLMGGFELSGDKPEIIL